MAMQRDVTIRRRGAQVAQRALTVGGAMLAVTAMAMLGWVLVQPSGGTDRASFQPPVLSTASPTPTPTPTPTAGPVTPTPTAKATPTRRTTPAPVRQTTPEPRPTEKPPAAELPPPPPPPAPTTGPNCPSFNGEPAAFAQVREALSSAGATDFWGRAGVDPPIGLGGPINPPAVTIPADLMNAIAMTESTWRSNVIACDGGIGTMQLMPGTVDWMHDRFNNSFDVNTLDGNTKLGAAYLEWLTVYFGIFYFGESFNLSTSAPVGAGGAQVVLRDVVIAAYNVGFGAVENDHGTPAVADDTLEIPNQWYVDRVNGYRANCPCDAF
jgi:hypothetical protein